VLFVIALGHGDVAHRHGRDRAGDEIVKAGPGWRAGAGEWLSTLDLDPAILDRIYEEAEKVLPRVVSGVASFFTGGLSGLASFIFGAFLGFFMLFYILVDWQNLSSWLGAHLGVPADLGEGIVLDSTAAVRQYFKGLTISAIIVAVLIGLTMQLLGLPLAATIAVVTFITAYVPFLGAIVSGAFAFVVALGRRRRDQGVHRPRRRAHHAERRTDHRPEPLREPGTRATPARHAHRDDPRRDVRRADRSDARRAGPGGRRAHDYARAGVLTCVAGEA
jgi:hypothetical protein